MRPGFEFLKTLIDLGYVDAENALVSEAFEGAGEGEDFMTGTCPIVMAYWGAANTDTAYGSPSFNMEVIGFPSARGQMPVLSMTGCGVGERAEHRDEALEVVDVICSDEALQLYAETNRVISPSKNVEVECVEALRPLNDLVQADTYVLSPRTRAWMWSSGAIRASSCATFWAVPRWTECMAKRRCRMPPRTFDLSALPGATGSRLLRCTGALLGERLLLQFQ